MSRIVEVIVVPIKALLLVCLLVILSVVQAGSPYILTSYTLAGRRLLPIECENKVHTGFVVGYLFLDRAMLVLTLSSVILAARLLQVAAVQQPFHANIPNAYTSKFAAYDSGLISPIEDLGTLSAAEYTTLLHPAYPYHSVRIKQNTGGFCDDTVRSVACAAPIFPSSDFA
jgi:hypothetical protein